MVLIRLPLPAGRDIVEMAFGVSGGENGFSSSFSNGGDRGVFGRGFSRLLTLLVLLSCCFGNSAANLSGLAGAGATTGAAVVVDGPLV